MELSSQEVNGLVLVLDLLLEHAHQDLLLLEAGHLFGKVPQLGLILVPHLLHFVHHPARLFLPYARCQLLVLAEDLQPAGELGGDWVDSRLDLHL